eukprot:scaffold6018_cov110-Alexandrium_tamarense.AAC.2
MREIVINETMEARAASANLLLNSSVSCICSCCPKRVKGGSNLFSRNESLFTVVLNDAPFDIRRISVCNQ